MRTHHPGRRAAVALESAIVYPVLFVLLFGLIVGGMGVFRYQMVARMAREAARYASVRGGDWQTDTGQPSPTQAQITQDIVVPLAVSLDTQQLTVGVEVIDGVSGTVTPWDSSGKWPTSLNASGQPVANRVRVTVTYHWYAELFLGSPVTMQSVSETPMSF
jgi:Flp pilus assembly protein TadG